MPSSKGTPLARVSSNRATCCNTTCTATGAPGRVELWPVVQAEEQSELLPWAPPVVRRHQDDPESRLASVIAAKISLLARS